MNSELQTFARQNLKEGLAKCTKGQRWKFKRMYAQGNMDSPIWDVVERMTDEKLDRAMEQVEATIKLNASNRCCSCHICSPCSFCIEKIESEATNE